MEFVCHDPKPAKGQSKLLGWGELKKFLSPSAAAKNVEKDVNPRFLQNVRAFQWRYDAGDLWTLTGNLCRKQRWKKVASLFIPGPLVNFAWAQPQKKESGEL